MSDADNLLTEWSRLVAASLAASGIRDVVVSPGSRSTPFALAIAARDELRVTSVIDERSAAFLALGMGRATGRPAAVLATSGTAPAHWLPAVIEASIANLPLVLLSADRPLALAQAGAAQTIDQTKLFGSWPRFFADLGDPRDDDSALDGVVRTIGQAIALARGPLPGPVHLNLRADKPLEPVERHDALHARVDARIARGPSVITTGASGPDEAFAQALAAALTTSERPLVVVGPRQPRAASIAPALKSLKLPVAAEASSQVRFGVRAPATIDSFEHLFSCAAFAERRAPDLVLQIGSLPTPTLYGKLASSAQRFILDPGGIRDPLGGAAALSTSDAAATLRRVAELVGDREEPAYARALQDADAVAWSEVERVLATGFGEGAAIRAAMNALPTGAMVAIGNSLPIRTLDRFVRGTTRETTFLSQRGVNGIDGLVAGAAGAALATGKPTLAILGDVSLLHDAGSLLSLASVRTPLVVLVIDNRGGRIFEELPIAREPRLARLMPLFTTPHAVDLGQLAGAYGVPFAEATSASQVAAAVTSGLAQTGALLLRAIVPPQRRQRLARFVRRRAIAEALA